MMIWTARFSRKRAVLAVAAMGVVMTVLLLLTGRAPETEEISLLRTNEERVAYLRELGWEVEPEPVESLQFLLPETLEEPYLSYNALQLPRASILARAAASR